MIAITAMLITSGLGCWCFSVKLEKLELEWLLDFRLLNQGGFGHESSSTIYAGWRYCGVKGGNLKEIDEKCVEGLLGDKKQSNQNKE